ncbi:alpha/beta hydrolase [Nocardia gipuzkoensis]
MTIVAPSEDDIVRDSARTPLMGTASLAVRLAPTALTPLRWSLRLLTVAGKLSPITARSVFAITSCTDRYAAPLLPPRGVRRILVEFGEDFDGEWLWHTRDTDAMSRAAALLYMHGGGFISCGLATHRRLAAKIGQAAGMPVLSIAYRQLPTVHITDTVDDCVRAYRYLLDEGFQSRGIILAGDSVGGGLAFLTALTAHRYGLPKPAGIIALSPFADLDNSHRLAHRNAGRDPYIPTEALGVLARWGYQRANELDPAWSPINGNFAVLPPVLIQVGSTEILLSDAERVARRCAKFGVPCDLQVWDRAPHVFQLGSDLFPEAQTAIHRMAVFARQRTRNYPTSPDTPNRMSGEKNNTFPLHASIRTQ